MGMTNQAPLSSDTISHSTQVQSGRISTERIAQLRKQHLASRPLWRRPFVGYLCMLPLLLLALAATLLLKYILSYILVPAAFIYLVVLLIAMIWGTGPAILSVVGAAVLLNIFVLPLGSFYPVELEDIFQLLPFIISSFVMIFIVSQRERILLNTNLLEKELENYANELEKINMRLENIRTERDRFLSIASHEIKNPITSIRGQSQLQLRRLTKRSIDINDMISVFKNIDEQTNRLTSLINEFIDVNTFCQGKGKLNKRCYDFNELCREVVEDQCLISNRTINFDPAPFPVNMQIDVERMTQVLVNLVGNALKYSPRNTVVELRLVRDPNNVRVEVQDYGNGISPDQLPHIFDAFYRTPDAVVSTTDGFGLGLAIVKDIVTRHGGSIWCESTVGRGSTFFVELPLTDGVEEERLQSGS
jgi:signal transduction histidine kinase